MFNLSEVTLGADPEIFIGRRGEIVSGHTVNCGTKEAPLQTKRGAVQVDGMALEVNVKPAKNKIQFILNLGGVMQDLAEIVAKADPEMYLVVQPTAFFTETYLKSLPEEVTKLGCNPDWNAYSFAENPTPDASVGFRTAGGHIHIGWGDIPNPESIEHIAKCADVAKQLDFLIGLASLEFDRDTQRRQLYGKAGAFRPKKYGMEYRTLSPAWLNSTQTTGLVYDRTMKALRMLNEGLVLDEKFPGFAQEMIDNDVTTWATQNPDVEASVA